jgi:hypothetical protein
MAVSSQGLLRVGHLPGARILRRRTAHTDTNPDARKRRTTVALRKQRKCGNIAWTSAKFVT